MIIVFLGMIIFIFYLIITRKVKESKYKAIDLKKKVRDDLNLQYKFFGITVNKPLYEGMKQVAYVIGYMPMRWNIQKKRYENIVMNFDKKKFFKKISEISQELYKKPFKELSPQEKKATMSVVKSDMKNQYLNLQMAKDTKPGETVKIKNFKKEITYNESVDMVALKVSKSGIGKFIAMLFPSQAVYFILEKQQIEFNTNVVNMASGIQRQPYYKEFIFTKSARATLDNTGFKIEREQLMQETANQIPRTVFFDIDSAKRSAFLREQADITSKRFKSQKEAHQD